MIADMPGTCPICFREVQNTDVVRTQRGWVHWACWAGDRE